MRTRPRLQEAVIAGAEVERGEEANAGEQANVEEGPDSPRARNKL